MKFPLHTRIFIGMVVGATLGLVTQFAGTPPETVDAIIKWVKPVGDIFLRMIFMMVIPLILSGLMLGIADLGDLKKVGRIGLITLMFSVVVTTISVFIGIGLTALVRPGDGLNAAERTVLVERFGETTQTVAGNMNAVREKSIGEIIVSLVPRNPLEDMVNAFNPNYTGGGLLAVMFFAVIAGIALSRADKERTSTFKRMLEGLYDLVMEAIKMAMQLAPFGVAALLYTMTAKMGWGIFVVLSKYVLVVVAALAIHQFGTYSLLLKFVGRMSPGFFFRNVREAMLTAFSTSSSNATLPTAIRVAQ
ncbi:MAG TPA: dicarboxylate/amino acid:cation symporter, partial [Chitinophagales bacterium]|nr:dicarboxylate/amino acid:cation symporter [Chitinophagales bacterium]